MKKLILLLTILAMQAFGVVTVLEDGEVVTLPGSLALRSSWAASNTVLQGQIDLWENPTNGITQAAGDARWSALDGSNITDQVAFRANIGAPAAIAEEWGPITNIPIETREFDFDTDLKGEWVVCPFFYSPDFSLTDHPASALKFYYGWEISNAASQVRVVFTLPSDATKVRLNGWCDTNGMTSADGFRIGPVAYGRLAGYTNVLEDAGSKTVSATQALFSVTNDFGTTMRSCINRQVQVIDFNYSFGTPVTNRVDWWLYGVEAFVPKTEAYLQSTYLKDAINAAN